VIKLDFLGDWIADLQAEYDRIMADKNKYAAR
jgi:hypothetical protein